MEPIRNFDQLTSHLKTLNKRKRIAVVCANDPNTEYAIARALDEGIAEFLMIGDSAILEKYPMLLQEKAAVEKRRWQKYLQGWNSLTVGKCFAGEKE